MYARLRTVLIAAIVAFTSCCTSQSVPQPRQSDDGQTSNTVTIGNGLLTVTPEPHLPMAEDGIGWYVAFKVSASAADQSPVLHGTDAKTAWMTIVRALGLNNGEESYSFVVTPTVNQVTLPPLTALQIDHKNAGGLLNAAGETLTVNTVGQVFSAWVPVEAGTKVSFTVTNVGSKDPNFSLLSDVESVAKNVQSSGFAIPSNAAYGMAIDGLNVATAPIQNVLNNANTYKFSTNWTNNDFPLRA